MDRADLGPLPAFVNIMHLPHLQPEANNPQEPLHTVKNGLTETRIQLVDKLPGRELSVSEDIYKDLVGRVLVETFFSQDSGQCICRLWKLSFEKLFNEASTLASTVKSLV